MAASLPADLNASGNSRNARARCETENAIGNVKRVRSPASYLWGKLARAQGEGHRSGQACSVRAGMNVDGEMTCTL
jgi:hypothetical protein